MTVVAFWQFSAIVLVSYLGLPAGFILASLTKEELQTGRKFFPLLRSLAFLLFIAIFANFLGLAIFPKMIFYAFGILLAVTANIQLLYAILGLLIGMADDGSILLVLSSLAFIFGLLSGSMLFPPLSKRKSLLMIVRPLLSNSGYIFAALIWFLLRLR